MLKLNPTNPTVPPQAFDRPIILQRSPILSRAVLWGIVGVTSFTFIWACVAKIDEAIPATGKLEPQGAVQEVKVPINGVVQQVNVREGQRVKQGEVMLTLDPTTAQAQQTALQKVKSALMEETAVYRSVLQNPDAPAPAAGPGSAEVIALTQSRSKLIAEAQLYQAQLTGDSPGGASNQQFRLQTYQAETASRQAVAQLEIDQLERQLAELQVQFASAQDLLAVNQGIYRDLEPVAKQGGISRVQFLQQQQEVRTRQAQVDQLAQSQERIQLAIAQAQEKLRNTVANSVQDTSIKLSETEKRIAEIDGQLNKAIVENQKRIAELDSQLSQAQMTLQYQALRAPAAGTVFDLKASAPGFVINPTEAVLKVVPDNSLMVEVFITNKDIGFIQVGMPVDIRVDTFPFSEFGDIKGKLVAIGTDALPPTQLRPFYSFPVKIQLDQQFLQVNGREVPLQSGMGVSVNIKTRSRTIMSIFNDGLAKGLESLKFMR
jgi:hemolysin D